MFATRKKRQDGSHRAAPVPPALLDALDLVQGIRERQAHRSKRLWLWSHMPGWRAVHAVMQDAARRAAGLAQGPQARAYGGQGRACRSVSRIKRQQDLVAAFPKIGNGHVRESCIRGLPGSKQIGRAVDYGNLINERT